MYNSLYWCRCNTAKMWLFPKHHRSHKVNSVDCVFVPNRWDNLVGVHGGSSEGRMGHEPTEAWCQRHRLGHSELQQTGISHMIYLEADRVVLSTYLRFKSLPLSPRSSPWNLELEHSALFHRCSSAGVVGPTVQQALLCVCGPSFLSDLFFKMSKLVFVDKKK